MRAKNLVMAAVVFWLTYQVLYALKRYFIWRF